jgi:putative membrane protein
MVSVSNPVYAEDVGWQPARPRFRPLRLVVSWIISALALLAAAAIVPGVEVKSFGGALLVALVVGILNAVLPPLVAAVRLPYTVAAGFILVLVLDALMLILASDIVPEAITVDNFGWALLAALVTAAVGVVLKVIEELISFHGGLGGPQTQPFVLYPKTLPLFDEPLVGAARIHELLSGWRAGLQGAAGA